MPKLILLLLACILVFASAQKEFLKPKTKCRNHLCVRKNIARFCVKYEDGSIKDYVKNCSDAPCGNGIVGYFRGSCSELKDKSHIQN